MPKRYTYRIIISKKGDTVGHLIAEQSLAKIQKAKRRYKRMGYNVSKISKEPK